jgi:DNA polymerase-3 subunit delta
MAAFKGAAAERAASAPPDSAFLFLLHGPDAGLVRERALRIADKRVDDRRDPFQFVELSGDAVAADPLILLDEANTVPLFGGRRAVLVEAGSKSFVSALETLLAAPPAACTVVVAAGALKWDSPLRKLVEGARAGAAIECQPDSEQDLNALVERTLHEAGLSATPEARELLHAALGEDRLMSRAELAKLVLYMHGRTKVEADDVEAIVAHAATAAADRLVFDAFSGKTAAGGAAFDLVLAQGGDGSALIFSGLRYALALSRATLAAERGGAESGLVAFKRAGFAYVHRAILESHLKAWPAARVSETVARLRLAQARARAHSETAEMEASRALLAIAREAAGRRKQARA